MSNESFIEQSLSDSHAAIVAIQRGDGSAIGLLTQSLRPYLKHVVRSEMVSSGQRIRDDDSDLVQQALLQAIENQADFRGQTLAEWRAWLAVIAKNQVRTSKRFWSAQRRAVGREIGLEDAGGEVIGTADSPTKLCENKELSDRLAVMVGQLSEAHQQLIHWRNRDCLSHAEIASRLNISVDSARQRCKSAMDRLRQLWKTEGE